MSDSDDSFNDAIDYQDDQWSDGDMLDDSIQEDTSRYQNWDVLDLKELTATKDSMVEDVSDMMGQPAEVVSMLLRSFKWNREKLESQFLTDPSRILSHAGLQSYSKKSSTDEEEIECAICDEDLPRSECFALGCNHWFCKTCWNEYLTNKVHSEGFTCIITKCPEYKCNVSVPDSVFKQLCNDQTYQRYEEYIVRSYVEDTKDLKWCPAPRCDRAIRGSSNTEHVKCGCNFTFCFRCNEELHRPASCDQVRAWLDKCKDQSETAHWIIANTKQCPKCRVRIEKNHGCNHMTCRSCKHEFCWVCFGPWSTHGAETGGFYKCNKFDPKKAKEEGKASEAKIDLDRYLHYYQRYHNHGQSKKFAQKQQERTEQRMAELQQSSEGRSWIDVQFLKIAMEQVFELRQVLAFTYVFAYYLEDSKERDLFEYLQQQLEVSTEKLSELSEKPLEQINEADIVNYTRVTAQFMKNLLDGVANGLMATDDRSSSSSSSSSS